MIPGSSIVVGADVAVVAAVAPGDSSTELGWLAVDSVAFALAVDPVVD
jgi:hypothetical protein